MKNKVYIVTSVHPWNDNRIYHKNIISLSHTNYDFCYIAPTIPPEKIQKDVAYLSIPESANTRLKRNIYILRKLIFKRKSLFHFHDPELIAIGIVLKFLGWKIIYDMHEDYFLSLKQRAGSRALNLIKAHSVRFIERLISPFFSIVIAEKVYAKHFPKSTEVLNYPNVNFTVKTKGNLISLSRNAIYTGTISEARGALLFSNFLKCFPDYSLTVIGRCDDKVKVKILDSCSAYNDRLNLLVSKDGYDFCDIENVYRSKSWDFGLAIFPDTPHYRDKLLTKFYEYIEFGIPTLASDFPTWTKFFSTTKCGFVVNVDNVDGSLQRLAGDNLDQKLLETKIKCKNNNKKFTWHSQFRNLENLYLENFNNN